MRLGYTVDDAIFVEDGDDNEQDTDDVYLDLPMKAILRSCLKILITTSIVNGDYFFVVKEWSIKVSLEICLFYIYHHFYFRTSNLEIFLNSYISQPPSYISPSLLNQMNVQKFSGKH